MRRAEAETAAGEFFPDHLEEYREEIRRAAHEDVEKVLEGEFGTQKYLDKTDLSIHIDEAELEFLAHEALKDFPGISKVFYHELYFLYKKTFREELNEKYPGFKQIH